MVRPGTLSTTPPEPATDPPAPLPAPVSAAGILMGETRPQPEEKDNDSE